MPKASKRSKSNNKDRSSKKATTEVAKEPTKEKKNKIESESKKSKAKEEKPQPKVTEPTVAEPETVEDGTKRQRRQVTRESILEDFDSLLTSLNEEVESIRTADAKTKKTKGVKFLRTVVKQVKGLRSDAARVMRTRKQSNRPKNTSSGFMKPVQISSEMAKFTGWEPDVPRSRVDVTKYLCQYIREKELQNPSDRRIIKPDGPLTNLLNLKDVDTEKNPLTYYSLQKNIQHHFKADAKA